MERGSQESFFGDLFGNLFMLFNADIDLRLTG